MLQVNGKTQTNYATFLKWKYNNISKNIFGNKFKINVNTSV